MPFALVTGGSRGIGRAIVQRLARDGCDAAFVWRRDSEAAAAVEKDLRALGRRCLALQADLGDAGQVEVTPHHVEKTHAISIGSFLQIVQVIAPRMGEGGRIVTISGMDTHRYVAGHGVLASAKGALETLTKSLAVEAGPRGITVNAVNPGYVATDSVECYFGGEEAKRAFYRGARGRDAAARRRRAGGGGRPGGLPLPAPGELDAGPSALPRRRHLPARTRSQRALVAADGTAREVTCPASTGLRPSAHGG
jgi:NAD(P)-dependent dehydrogenase (short-subunit alcohol dehydrogenase family)